MNAFVAPDGSYLIFGSDREGGYGGGDLYISFKKNNEGWTAPVNPGPLINTPSFEYCPSVSPDGRFLFFTRIVEGDRRNGDIFWVDFDL